MDGEIPKFLIADRASRAKPPAMPRRALPFRLRLRWHWVALAALCVPLSFVLVHSGKAPNADMLAALADWVERGKAPQGVTLVEQSAKPPFVVSRARPLCQWPLVPRYKGGDAASASSFACEP